MTVATGKVTGIRCTSMDPAVIGAVSVAGGVVLSIGGQLLVDGRRSRREREAEAKRGTRQLRLAVRLVMEELADAAGLIENAARSRRYWPAPRELATTTWNEYKMEIAGAIDSALDWRSITSAYDAVNDLNWTVQHRRTKTTPAEELEFGARLDEHDHMRAKWRTIQLAMKTLETTIAVQGSASRMLRKQGDAESEFWPFGDGDDFNLDDAMDAQRQQAMDAAGHEAEL